MKLLKILISLILACAGHVIGQAQIVPSCLGCMPRTGKVVDSTMTSPSPPFTTSAQTGDIYIPPREVRVEVATPAPAPAGDPTSFQATTTFLCSKGGTGAYNRADAAVITAYQSVLKRCADAGGMQFWGTELANCVAGVIGWDAANAAPVTAFTSKLVDCGTNAGLKEKAAGDEAGVNALCSTAATGLGYSSASSYKYVYGAFSQTCSK